MARSNLAGLVAVVRGAKRRGWARGVAQGQASRPRTPPASALECRNDGIVRLLSWLDDRELFRTDCGDSRSTPRRLRPISAPGPAPSLGSGTTFENSLKWAVLARVSQPVEKPTQERTISGTFRGILDPGFRRGDGGGKPPRPVVAGGFSRRHLGRRWSGAGCCGGSQATGTSPRGEAGALPRESPHYVGKIRVAQGQASRRPEASKEPHDSIVPVFQWRRGAKPALGARSRSRRREPTTALGPAGHHDQAGEIASSPKGEAARARYETDWGLAMTMVGFSQSSRPKDVSGSQ